MSFAFFENTILSVNNISYGANNLRAQAARHF